MSVTVEETSGGRRSGRQIGRPIIWGAVGLVVALIAAFLAIKIFGDSGGTIGSGSFEVRIPATGENAAAEFEGGPERFVYLGGTAIQGMDTSNFAEETLAELPAPYKLPNASFSASPGSRWITYVIFEAGKDVTTPTIRLFDPEGTADPFEIGTGVDPLWTRTGEVFAFRRPLNLEQCTVDDCSSASEVVLYEPQSRSSKVLLEEGRWDLLGWSAGSLLVADADNPETTLSVTVDGATSEIDVPSEEVLAASPDGKWLLTSSFEKAQFVPFDGSQVTGDPVTIPVRGLTLTDAVWAHDSSRVAAVALLPLPGVTHAMEKTKKEEELPTVPTPELVVFSVDERKPRMVEETFGAQPPLFWSIDGDAITFVKGQIEQGQAQNVFECPVSSRGECKILVPLSEGLVPLRVE